MRIVLTGSTGFLGWHTRLRIGALTESVVVPVTRSNWSQLMELISEADAVIHVAGINRASTDSAVESGNLELAEVLGTAIESHGRPLRVVMAGTIQEQLDNPYGRGKRAASSRLEAAANRVGGHFVHVCLPNLFGEHGKPNYNSFVATFVDALIKGDTPTVNDNPVELLHAQDAAQALIDGLTTKSHYLRPTGQAASVGRVWSLLKEFHAAYYPSGEVPDLGSKFRIDLFNTYRAALFPNSYPIRLVPHSDSRGSFVETVRCRGGEGQASFSSTVPGVTRGEHYHLSKIERFAVIQGTARISLRKMYDDEIIDFEVSGDVPVAIDMPVGWVHNITNTGEEILLTQFWSHELFRPEAPDTFPEPVRPIPKESSQ